METATGLVKSYEEWNKMGRCVCGHMKGRHFATCIDGQFDPRKGVFAVCDCTTFEAQS